MGRAISQQKQVAEDLQQVLDVLAGRHESEGDGLVHKLRRLQSDLGKIADAEQELQKRMAAAAGNRARTRSPGRPAEDSFGRRRSDCWKNFAG